jgi:hypothetical protein
MRFPLSPTHQTPLVNAIKFDASVADIAKRWKLHLIIFGLSSKRVVDFRSGWALSWGRPMSRFTRFARSRVSSVTLIPKESPSLHSNQPIYITYVLKNIITNFLVISLF